MPIAGAPGRGRRRRLAVRGRRRRPAGAAGAGRHERRHRDGRGGAGHRPVPGHGRQRRRRHPRRGQGRHARRDVRRHPRRERPHDAPADPPLPPGDRAGRGGGPGRGARRGRAHPARPRLAACRRAPGRERGRRPRASRRTTGGSREDRDRHRRAWGRFTRNFVVQGTGAEWALCWLADLRNRLWRLAGRARCTSGRTWSSSCTTRWSCTPRAALADDVADGGAPRRGRRPAGCCSAASRSTSRSTSRSCAPGPTPAERAAGPLGGLRRGFRDDCHPPDSAAPIVTDR